MAEGPRHGFNRSRWKRSADSLAELANAIEWFYVETSFVELYTGQRLHDEVAALLIAAWSMGKPLSTAWRWMEIGKFGQISCLANAHQRRSDKLLI